jgi:Zn-dependent peptidase ImmA (M78 family)
MFRRGFKTWAEQTSLRVRQKLKVPVSAPLDPSRLADLLGIFIVALHELSELASDIRQRLLNDHEDNWSAITVSNGQSHMIVVNSSHPVARTNSNLAHEIAHIILGHEPSMMFISPSSGTALRTHNEEQEDEANWLAGALLLPRDALLAVRRRGLSDEEACREYGVSSAMLRFRFNVTGVDVQLRRSHRR